MHGESEGGRALVHVMGVIITCEQLYKHILRNSTYVYLFIYLKALVHW